MALFGWGKRPTRAVPEQPFHAARVPMAQSIMDSHNPSYRTETVVEIVNRLLFDGGFTRAELPPELLMGYSVDYYLAQVNNGGHAQFGHNSRLVEGTLSDIRQGLVAMGDLEAAGIFADFEAYRRDDPAGFTQGLTDGWKNPVMKSLDDRFYAGLSKRLVNRRPKRTLYRRAKGTPFVKQRDGYEGRTVCAGCGVGRAQPDRRRNQRKASSSGCPGRQLRCLKRQLSLPVSTMSQWWVMRSSSAVVILGSPKTVGHSPKARFVVTMTEVCS
jgi:hypothetical protein